MKETGTLNKLLWTAQLILAALYVSAGVWKVTGEGPSMETMMPGFSLTLIRLVGVVETLAALGLVLPVASRKMMRVSGWAGAILAAEAVLFVVHHVSHGAYGPAGVTFVLGLLAAFVAWGRSKREMN